MSGGSFNYMYSKLRNAFEGEMQDPMLEEILHDFVQVLHDREWAEDCDITEEDYKKSVADFKAKWGRRYPELPADRKKFIADKIHDALPDITKRFEESLIEAVPKIINSEIKCADCWCYTHAAQLEPKGTWKRNDIWIKKEYAGGFYHVECKAKDQYYIKWPAPFCPYCGKPMLLDDEGGIPESEGST